MEKLKYKWLLFDVDGTLLNYDQSEKHALKESFISFQIDYKQKYLQKYKEINANLWKEFEKGLISSLDLRVKRFELLFHHLRISFNPSLFSIKYLEALGQTDFLMAGCWELINKLKRHYRLAIITNGIKEVQYNRLKQTGLSAFFEHIIISEEAGIAKPDKKFFDYTLNTINFHQKDEILIIGDSLNSDIQGGNMSGIDTCWFNPNSEKNRTGIKPTFEIKSLKSIDYIIEIP